MSNKRDPLLHFLLVFDHAEGKLIEEESFNDVDEAIAAYEQRETNYDKSHNIEVVLIGADSIETVHQTHANYYNGTAALARALAQILTEFGEQVESANPSPER